MLVRSEVFSPLSEFSLNSANESRHVKKSNATFSLFIKSKRKKEKRKKQKFQKSKRGKEKGTYIVEFKRRKIELCGQQILPMVGNSNFILMFYYHCI